LRRSVSDSKMLINIFYFLLIHFLFHIVITRVYLADNGQNALFFRKYQID
jgi:hypothetical protein